MGSSWNSATARGWAALLLSLSVLVASCSLLPTAPRTLDQIRAGWACIEYKEHLPWQALEQTLGTPDLYPLPPPGDDLSKNTRVYLGESIIVYTERREIRDAGKVRFQEIITRIEMCRKE